MPSAEAKGHHRTIVQYVTGHGDRKDANGHGTHVAGCINGQAAVGQVESVKHFGGIASESKLAFFDIGGENGYTIPYDLGAHYFNWAYTIGGRIHSNSWGGSKYAYTEDEQTFDRYAKKHGDMLLIVAAGNSGGSSANKHTTVGSPANAKVRCACTTPLYVGYGVWSLNLLCPYC